MRRVSYIFALIALLGCAAPEHSAGPKARPARSAEKRLVPTLKEPLKEVERIEDCRILLCYGIWNVQAARSVTLYANGFGANIRDTRLEDLIKEGLGLYELLKGLDDSGQSLQCYSDYGKHPYLPQDRMLLTALTDVAARKVVAFYQRTLAAEKDRRQALANAVAQKNIPEPIRIAALPWTAPPREKGRKLGFIMGWPLSIKKEGAQADYLLDKANKFGADCIVLWDDAATWSKIEQSQGEFDFAEMDRLFDKVKGHGLKVKIIIYSLNAQPPDWLAGAIKSEVQFLASDGKKKRGINLYNPRVRKLFDKYLDALAGHIKDNWNDVIVGIDLESGYKFDLAGYDYSPFADAEWQRWLKAKYRSVDEMNQAWGTNVAGWDKVEQPRERPKDSPRLALDWFSWREKYLADYFEFQYRRLGKLLPDMLIGVRAEFRDQHGMFVGPEAAKDVHKIVRQASDIGMHGGMSAFLDDFLRGVSEGKWLYNWHTAICFGSVTGQVMYTSFFKDVIGEYISGGAGGILRHNYTWFLDRHMDRQIKIDSIGSYFIPLREMKYVAPQILNTEVRSDIAVLWPKVSMKTGGSPAETEAIAMACILTYAGHTGDYLTEEQINRGRLAKYKVLILPSARHLPAETVAKIREYVNNGGSLLALTDSSLGAASKKFALADVYGADHGGRIFWQPLGTVEKDKTFRILVALPRKQKGLFYARKISKYWQSFHHYQPRKGAKVIGVYPGGQAAAVMNEFGKGKSILVGYPLGQIYYTVNRYEVESGKIMYWHSAFEEQLQMEKYLDGLLKRLGVKRPARVVSSRLANPGEADWDFSLVFTGGPTYEQYRVRTESPDRTFEITLREREGMSTRFLCLADGASMYSILRDYMNYWCTQKVSKVQVNLPGIKSVYDVSVGAAVPFRKTGGGITFTTSFAPSMGKVFAISTEEAPEIFPEGKRPGIGPEELVAKLKTKKVKRPAVLPEVIVMHLAEVKQVVDEMKGKEITIACGQEKYLALGKKLAAVLEREWRCRTTLVLSGIKSGDFTPETEVDIFLGNETANRAMITFSLVQLSPPKKPKEWIPLNLSAWFPPPGIGVIQPTRPFVLKGAFGDYDRVPMRLILGGSDFHATQKAVNLFIKKFL